MSTFVIIVGFIGALAGGIGIGMGIILIFKKPTTTISGDLIMTKDDEGIYLSVVLEQPPATLLDRKYVLFRVKNYTHL